MENRLNSESIIPEVKSIMTNSERVRNMANGDINGNGKVSRWVVGILLTLLLFMAGLQFGQSTVKPDIAANKTKIEVHSTEIQAIKETLREIKDGVSEVNRKLDNSIIQGK